MKKQKHRWKIVAVIAALVAAGLIFYGCHISVNHPASPPSPKFVPLAVVPVATNPASPTPVQIPIPQPAAPQEVTQAVTPTYKTVALIRTEDTGDYLLPDGLTFRQVVEVYMNGQPVNRDRVTVLDPGDAIDIWDARDGDKITALVQ